VVTKLRFIDPADCGCSDCLTGEAVPLDCATGYHIRDLLAGKLTSRLDEGTEIEITVSITLGLDEIPADLERVRALGQVTRTEIAGHFFDI
jgi:hypothetical protein